MLFKGSCMTIQPPQLHSRLGLTNSYIFPIRNHEGTHLLEVPTLLSKPRFSNLFRASAQHTCPLVKSRLTLLIHALPLQWDGSGHGRRLTLGHVADTSSNFIFRNYAWPSHDLQLLVGSSGLSIPPPWGSQMWCSLTCPTSLLLLIYTLNPKNGDEPTPGTSLPAAFF